MSVFELVVGGVTVDATAVVSVRVQPLGASPRRAKVHVRADCPALAAVDLSSRAVIRHSETHEAEFTGIVERALVHKNATVEFELATEDVLIAELRMDGMCSWRADRLDGVDVIYSLVRACGLHDDEMQFEVYTPRVATFEVSAPVSNVFVTDPIAVGPVTVTPRDDLRRAIDDAQPPELVQRWHGSEAWAITFVSAPNLIEAEWKGTEEIDCALACLALGNRVGTLITPDRSVTGYDRRAATRAAASRGDIVHVRSTSDGRRWVRGVRMSAERVPLDPAFSRIRLDPPKGDRDRLALDAWRRAVSATDPLAEIAAVWQSWEFYAAGVRVQRLFTKAQRQALLEAAVGPNEATLDAGQLVRVKKVLDRINDAPLLDVIRHALSDDGVPVSHADLEALGRHRKARNDLDHGRQILIPRGSDRRLVLALLTRALAWRLRAGSNR